MAYKIVVTVDAKNDLEQFINYLIFDRKNTGMLVFSEMILCSGCRQYCRCRP